MQQRDRRGRWCTMSSDKLYKGAWYLFVLTFVISIGTCAWWLFYPYEPIIVKSIEIFNPDKQVKAGDELIYKITYDKKMDLKGELIRTLNNGVKITLSSSDVAAPVGKDCDKVRVKIPGFADPGKDYFMGWHVEYRVNMLRRVSVYAESDKFEVVK